MLDSNPTVDTSLSLDDVRAIDAVCDRFESAWRGGARPRAEDYLGDLPPETALPLLAELLGLELYYRRLAGEAPAEA